jgi:hypothetical protein
VPGGQRAAMRTVPAAVWLDALDGSLPPAHPEGPYTLVQKNRTFSPHLLIVPVGSVVRFPNRDPFFHNVFSLFDGKRFDLGLYEAGQTRDVTFSREGLSYIFCNIHPEMSAVVIALASPLHATGSAPGSLVIEGVPPGEYALHVWVEGQNQQTLNPLTQHITVDGGEAQQTVELALSKPVTPGEPHLNKFGRPYDTTAKPVY